MLLAHKSYGKASRWLKFHRPHIKEQLVLLPQVCWKGIPGRKSGDSWFRWHESRGPCCVCKLTVQWLWSLLWEVRVRLCPKQQGVSLQLPGVLLADSALREPLHPAWQGSLLERYPGICNLSG